MTRPRLPVLTASCVALLAGAALAARLAPRPRARRMAPLSHHVGAARRLNRAAGTLAAAVLADSLVEHYRGAFHNKAMVAPLLSAALSIGVSAHGNVDPRPLAHRARDSAYAAAVLTGLVGTGFHLFNVRRRPGGVSWQNLFYGAPLGAPGALLLSGLTGFLAERVRHARPGATARLAGLPAGRIVAAVTAFGLAGTVAEVALLHFRGAYHDPFMYAPVTLPPVTAVLLAQAAVGPLRPRYRLTRLALRLTALLGLAGVGFHAWGVSRNMGGWRNWTQNVLNGPPLPAPPGFTGLAIAGLAALGLLEGHPHE